MGLIDIVVGSAVSGRIVLAGGKAAPSGVRLRCRSEGDRYSFVIENMTATDLHIQEVVLIV